MLGGSIRQSIEIGFLRFRFHTKVRKELKTHPSLHAATNSFGVVASNLIKIPLFESAAVRGHSRWFVLLVIVFCQSAHRTEIGFPSGQLDNAEFQQGLQQSRILGIGFENELIPVNT